MTVIKPVKYFFVLVFWGLVWQGLSDFIIKDQALFPNTSTILLNCYNLIFVNSKIIIHILSSGKRYLLATLIATPLALLTAVFAAGSKKVRDLIYPLISFTYPLPKVALFPFLLLVFGAGDLSKIVMVALGIFYLIFINVYIGLASCLRSNLGDVVIAYQINKLNYWYHFLFKGSYQHLLVGLKSALGYGLTLIVVSEMSISKDGIGFFIWSAWDSFRIIDLYSALFILAAIGAAINWLCDFAIIKLARR